MVEIFISTFLLLLFLDEGKIFPLEQTIEVNLDATFTCFSNTSVVWRMPHRLLPLNVEILKNKKKLWIKKVGLQNRGYYECEGKDDNGVNFFSHGLLKVLSKILDMFLHQITKFSQSHSNYINSGVINLVYNKESRTL